MTIDELIQRLQDYRDDLGGDTEIRLMTQQNWPFENGIAGLASGAEINERDDGDDEDADDDNGGLHRRRPAALLRIEAGLGGRALKPKRPRGRRGGWFPPPEDGSQTTTRNSEETNDGYEEDHYRQEDQHEENHEQEDRQAAHDQGRRRGDAGQVVGAMESKVSAKAGKKAKAKAEPKDKRLRPLDAAAKHPRRGPRSDRRDPLVAGPADPAARNGVGFGVRGLPYARRPWATFSPQEWHVRDRPNVAQRSGA